MNELNRFMEGIRLLTGEKITLSHIGYETISFYKDEIDVTLIPEHILEQLDEPFTVSSANYTNKLGDYYTFIEVSTIEVEPYDVWLKNDEIIPSPLTKGKHQ